ncbi:HEAT repeat domain-containing protein [Natronorubrum halophilum]|uniref:HEAT repeat domain-containing protein n=1 Tax=Natronorubrum halophilum TaxID=1702106 RepID=UPI000EF727EC|nr:HEAT repeat domain-containing protein [Natronorubrum halophilum]
MDREGGEAIERQRVDSDSFDLPAVLAQLDRREPTEQRAAVETIRDALTEHPRACIPTVPKLRALLETPELECHESVAYCLAELADESPADVAPSVAVLVSVIDEHASRPATHELLRCLSTVTAERSAAVADHAATIADVIDRRSGYDHHGLCLFRALSMERPAAIEPAVPVLTDALAADPESNGVPTLSALGRVARSEASLPTLEFVEDAMALVDHDEASLRNNAIGCLADVARHSPLAVEPASADLTAALEHDDPETRANAAVAIARVATEATAAVDPAREPLLELLEDDHERVRANACVALGHGRVEAAADRLTTLARADPEPRVRDRAGWALGQLSS